MMSVADTLQFIASDIFKLYNTISVLMHDYFNQVFCPVINNGRVSMRSRKLCQCAQSQCLIRINRYLASYTCFYFSQTIYLDIFFIFGRYVGQCSSTYIIFPKDHKWAMGTQLKLCNFSVLSLHRQIFCFLQFYIYSELVIVNVFFHICFV